MPSPTKTTAPESRSSTAGTGVINTRAGNDLIGVTAVNGSLGSVLGGPLFLDLGADSNTLDINEANNAADDVLTFTASQVRGQGPLPFAGTRWPSRLLRRIYAWMHA